MEMQGDELKAIRKSLGWTQGEMAARLGMTNTYVGMMERGDRPIEKRTALAVGHLDFYQRAREERIRKLSVVEQMESGRLRSLESCDGVEEDVTAREIQRNLDEIAEIEQFLAKAGEPIELEPGQ